MPVCVLVAVIVTPGISAFVGSVTVPPRVAFVVCGAALEQMARRIAQARKILFIAPPNESKQTSENRFISRQNFHESYYSDVPSLKKIQAAATA